MSHLEQEYPSAECKECNGKGRIKVKAVCFDCKGTGFRIDRMINCYKCHGTGSIKKKSFGRGEKTETCPRCGGTGRERERARCSCNYLDPEVPTGYKLRETTCTSCNGAGYDDSLLRSAWYICPVCKGKSVTNNPYLSKNEPVTCRVCNGKGRIYACLITCTKCHGSGGSSYERHATYRYYSPRVGESQSHSGGTFKSKLVKLGTEYAPCSKCKDYRILKKETVTCKSCNGTGTTTSETRIPATTDRDAYTKRTEKECVNCKGKGKYEDFVSFE